MDFIKKILPHSRVFYSSNFSLYILPIPFFSACFRLTLWLHGKTVHVRIKAGGHPKMRVAHLNIFSRNWIIKKSFSFSFAHIPILSHSMSYKTSTPTAIYTSCFKRALLISTPPAFRRWAPPQSRRSAVCG